MSNVSDQVALLLRLLSEANQKVTGTPTGACLFVDEAGGPHCANLTHGQCTALNGNWDPDTTCVCDDPSAPGQCKAQ